MTALDVDPSPNASGDVVGEKLARLGAVLVDMAPVVVAFSGGADSAFLAAVAHEVLGADRARAVTAVSPSLAGVERDDCAALAAEWGLSWSAVETDEMARAAYRRNDADRCFHCKAELMDAVAPVAAASGGATVVLGVNLDDLDDHRPGQEAARQAGARFPLVDAGFTKAEVREASRRLGLRTWNKPAAACLASRVPHGTEVTVAVLGRVERAEAALRGLGFDGDLRVRHHGDVARIEVASSAIEALIAARAEITAALHGIGYRYVTVDLDGFRSGSLNPE